MKRILVTGSSGNLGRGIVPKLEVAGWQVRSADLRRNGDSGGGGDFHKADLRESAAWHGLADGCGIIIHCAAWHGIHQPRVAEAEFWNLNVNGTSHMFQEARRAGVRAVIFLSSQAWHQPLRKYGFTKRIGEQLCDYHFANHGISVAAVRPYDFTPWESFPRYGANLLYGGVDRNDVIDCVLACTEYFGAIEIPERFVVNAVRANAFSESDLADWELNPLSACERIFPGSAQWVTKYALAIDHKPVLMDLAANPPQLAWSPRSHFGSFIDQLARLDRDLGKEGVLAIQCPFAPTASTNP